MALIGAISLLFKAKTKPAKKSIKRLGTSVSNLGGHLKIAAAGLAGLASFSIAKNISSSAAETQQWADILGITSGKLKALNDVGAQFNITSERMNDSIKDLGERIADAETGTVTFTEAFDALGLKSKELIKLPLDVAFAKTMVALSKLENQNQKNFIANELMADAGFETIRMADALGVSLLDVVKKAEKLPNALSSLDISNLAEMDRGLGNLGRGFSNLFGKILSKAKPMIDSITGAVMRFLTSERVIGFVSKAMKRLNEVFILTKTTVKFLWDQIDKGADSTMELFKSLGRGIISNGSAIFKHWSLGIASLVNGFIIFKNVLEISVKAIMISFEGLKASVLDVERTFTTVGGRFKMSDKLKAKVDASSKNIKILSSEIKEDFKSITDALEGKGLGLELFKKLLLLEKGFKKVKKGAEGLDKVKVKPSLDKINKPTENKNRSFAKIIDTALVDVRALAKSGIQSVEQKQLNKIEETNNLLTDIAATLKGGGFNQGLTH